MQIVLDAIITLIGCLFVVGLVYFDYGMFGEYIYERKTVYIMPWKETLLPLSIIWAVGSIFSAIPFNLSLVLVNLECIAIWGVFLLAISPFIRKSKIIIRISRKNLIIIHPTGRIGIKLKYPVKDIENIEHIYFSELYMNFDKDRTNIGQSKGTYSYVVTCSGRNAVEGVDITLSNGKHVVFESDDVKNCIWALEKATNL